MTVTFQFQVFQRSILWKESGQHHGAIITDLVVCEKRGRGLRPHTHNIQGEEWGNKWGGYTQFKSSWDRSLLDRRALASAVTPSLPTRLSVFREGKGWMGKRWMGSKRQGERDEDRERTQE